MKHFKLLTRSRSLCLNNAKRYHASACGSVNVVAVRKKQAVCLALWWWLTIIIKFLGYILECAATPAQLNHRG